jgi:hypothetical protein
MKNTTYAALLTATLLGAAGCATGPRLTQLDQVGPGPVPAVQTPGGGFLQIFSARETAPRDLNLEEFAWNNDFGRNEFLHGAAHTRYTIYDADGRLLQRVPNAEGMHDAHPALVRLSPGLYRVEAESEDYNNVTLAVSVPVYVKAGVTTTVHLDGQWKPPGPVQGDEVVRLPNGRIVGWRYPGPAEGKYALRTDH